VIPKERTLNSLLSPEFLANPHPVLKALRESAPVMFFEPLNLYLALGYEAVRSILMDPDRFSNVVIENYISMRH
jgi:cytochrome P450